ncbi:neural/ectodermal development factor IMP-L2-like [Epargyreus clarus]|uniref:neural/ectodermal development factor IMP-L2-like n=1 Tax=Epargyreus clarus TaxID=520877 RepID=UPI003C3068D7
MFNLVSLLVAAALVSLQCSSEATARQIGEKKLDLDNALQPNAVSTAQRRRVRNFIRLEPVPETVRHLAGTPTVLVCAGNGHPAPTVAWMKNGELVSDFEEDTNEILNIHPTSYGHLISKLVVTAPSNGDVYTCVMTSSLKQQSASTTVLTEDDAADVLEQLFSVPTEPIISAYYENLLQDSGSSVVLPCRVSSFTKAQVYWQDPDNKIIYDSPYAKVLPSGDLFITKLRWSDMGLYTCTAKNMYGTDSITTFVYPMKPSSEN